MNPQTPNSPGQLAGLGIVVGAFATLWIADKATMEAHKRYTKFQAKRQARSWLRTWKEIDDLPTTEEV